MCRSNAFYSYTFYSVLIQNALQLYIYREKNSIKTNCLTMVVKPQAKERYVPPNVILRKWCFSLTYYSS